MDNFFELIWKRPSKAKEEQVVNLLTEKSNGKYVYTYREIAKKIHVTKSFVQDTAKRHGLERKGRRH